MSDNETRPTVCSEHIQSTLGVGHSTISSWRNLGLLKPITDTPPYKYYVDDLDQLLRDSAVGFKSMAHSFLALSKKPGETIISSSRAASLLHCSTRTVQQLVNDGELEAYKIAKTYHIVTDSVTSLVQKMALAKAISITKQEAAS